MPKLKCIVLDDYQNAALSLADWSIISNKVEVQVCNHHISNPIELVELIKNFDIVVTMRDRVKFRAELLNKLPLLKLLIVTGPPSRCVDIDAAKNNNIVVCNTGNAQGALVEMTWAMILGLTRNIIKENRNLIEQRWQETLGHSLYGKQLGVVGLGSVGGPVAKIGQAFGMKVVAWSHSLTPERANEVGVEMLSSKEELLETSDFVSIHLALNNRTYNLIQEPDLRLMKPTAFLINISRAAIIDQEAMIKALKENWIAGAGIDVFEVEPLPHHHILRSLPNILATPHIGNVTRENYKVYFGDAIENIQAFLAKSPIRVVEF